MKRIVNYSVCAYLISNSLPLDACKKRTDTKSPAKASIYDMRTNDLTCPIGIDDKNPSFSWKVKSASSGWLQSAYQIIVKKGCDTVWDSGKVASGISLGIKYAGQALESSTRYTWQVSVWDLNGTKTVSNYDSFEMGLLECDAFEDTEWISTKKDCLYLGTKYIIDFDFVIDKGNQGFCFGMSDKGTFVMWQVNTLQNEGRILLRPHFKSDGRWIAYPQGPGNVLAADVTSAVGYGGKEVIGKKIHERIAVDNKVIKTYFGKDSDSLTLANTYTHTSEIPLYNIGFRHSCVSSSETEIARYDNIVIRDADNKIIYKSDFSSSENDFFFSPYCLAENGMLKVGAMSNVGEQIYVLSTKKGLPVFRKVINVGKEISSAKLYTSGLGVYKSYINGKRVGRLMPDGRTIYHELKPGFTEAEKRKFYSAYDVTHMLKSNTENVLCAIVSSSWWSDPAAARYGKDNAYLAKLILTYADGSKQTVVTNTSWKVSNAAAVTFAEIYAGERYDARIDQSWMLPGFDDSSWDIPEINREFKGVISAWRGSPITVRADLQRDPISVTVYKGASSADASRYGRINVMRKYGNEPFELLPDETALVDFGQNFAGWEAFSVSGSEGTRLVITHGEMLNDNNGIKSRGNDGPEGSIYNANYRSAEATTLYTLCSKSPQEEYHPSFTFYGFRYVEIRASAKVTVNYIHGQVVTSVEKDIGFISTSDKDVNRLISNIRWGQYSNYLSVPTDCPQRDERQGWTADTQVFSKAGAYLAFSKSFLEKFMTDLRDSQRSDGAYPGTAPTGEYHGGGWGGFGWADAGIIVPYNLYMMFGDVFVIRENWSSMQLYIDKYLASTNREGGELIWGDWLAYESNDDTIRRMLAIAFYAWDALMMAQMAKAIAHAEEALHYMEIYQTEKEHFISRYVKSDGTLIRSEQSVCLYALYLDLLPNENSVNAVTNQLVTNIKNSKNRLQTGFLGTAILMPTLTKIGRSDIAYTLLLQHENPSWLYSVDQGATTVWERWNSYTIESGFGDVGMNSFNHYAYGTVASWMFEAIAGINYDTSQPGFKRIILAPSPDKRIEANASYDSPYGIITAKSTFNDNENTWIYECSLPSNTTAQIRIPVNQADNCTINGKALSKLTLEEDFIKLVDVSNGLAVFEALPGSFVFSAAM